MYMGRRLERVTPFGFIDHNFCRMLSLYNVLLSDINTVGFLNIQTKNEKNGGRIGRRPKLDFVE